MSQPAVLAVATPTTGNADGNTGWSGLKGTIVLRSGKGRGHEYRFDPPYFHHGYATYVARGPQGRESRVFREGPMWYGNGIFEKFQKHVQCQHLDGGDPNLPPLGSGWVSCDNSWPSSLAFTLATEFERKLKAVQGIHVNSTSAGDSMPSQAVPSIDIPPHTGVAGARRDSTPTGAEPGPAVDAMTNTSVSNPSVAEPTAPSIALQTPAFGDGGHGWAHLDSVAVLVNKKGLEFKYESGRVHHGFPAYVHRSNPDRESLVFREGTTWFYNGGRGGVTNKYAHIAHVPDSDPNLPPVGMASRWKDVARSHPLDSLKFAIAPGFEVAINAARDTNGAYVGVPEMHDSVSILEVEAELVAPEDNLSVPVNGALADRVMYDARLKEATQFRAKLVAEEDAACAVLQMQMEDLRMRVKEVEENVWTATQHRKDVLAKQDILIEGLQATLKRATSESSAFLAKVTARGIDDLGVDEVYELLFQLNAPVELEILKAQDVTGSVLAGVTEAEMLSVFKIKTLGERRRLAAALTRLAKWQEVHQPESDPWDTERVCGWLAKEGLASLEEEFRVQSIDGEALFLLNRDDLEQLGVTTLGGKASILRKIAALRLTLDLPPVPNI